MRCWRRRDPGRGEEGRGGGGETYGVWVVQGSEGVLDGVVEDVWGDGGDLLETGGVHAGDKVGGGAGELLVADGEAPLGEGGHDLRGGHVWEPVLPGHGGGGATRRSRGL